MNHLDTSTDTNCKTVPKCKFRYCGCIGNTVCLCKGGYFFEIEVQRSNDDHPKESLKHRFFPRAVALDSLH